MSAVRLSAEPVVSLPAMSATGALERLKAQPRERRPPRVPSRELQLLAAAVVVFVAVTAWWLSQDTRVPDFDSGTHLMHAFEVHSQVAAGRWTWPFTTWNTYPPLVHLVGGLTVFIAGPHTMAMMLASNIVFVPLLAIGCWGVGHIVYGRNAGLLAALFALGTPIIVSMMHEYDLDPPEAAMVAVSAWAILASRRFERLGIAALAGLASGLAFLTKETAVVFLAGLLAVVILRGGWRNWRGLVAFLVVLGAVAGPWYAYHAGDIRSAFDTIGNAASTPVQTPPRWSLRNLAWYFWNFLNEQALAPLTALVLVGIALGVRRSWREREPNNLVPELLGGLAVSYLGMTYLVHKDPRYTLPALVFAAALGTGWVAQLRSPGRRGAWTAALLTAVLVNFIGVSVGIGHPVRLALPNAQNTIIYQRQITFYSPAGWVRGGPEHDGEVLSLMHGLRRSGIRTIEIGPGAERFDFNQQGLIDFAYASGISVPYPYNPTKLGQHDAYITLRPVQPGDPPPCQRLSDGSGVYVSLGNPTVAFERRTLICPGRTPAIYRRTAPVPGSVIAATTTAIPEPARSLFLGLFQALHRQRIVHHIEFDASGQNVAFFAPIGLTRLAVAAGLSVPPVYNPLALGPRDAFLVRRFRGAGDPPACGRLPDGSSVYVVLGVPAQVFGASHFDCPGRAH